MAFLIYSYRQYHISWHLTNYEIFRTSTENWNKLRNRDFILDLYCETDWIIVTQWDSRCSNLERQMRITISSGPGFSFVGSEFFITFPICLQIKQCDEP